MKMSQENNYISFKNVMDELRDLEHNSLIKRDNSKYTGNTRKQGIEEIKIYDFYPCIMLEMAIRNKGVIDIINKLNYSESLIDKYPYLEYENDILFKPIDNNIQCGTLNLVMEDDNNEDKPPMITKDLEKEFIGISELPFPEFKKKLNKLVDLEYSNNYNKHYLEDMINDGIDDILDINEETIRQYKFKDSTSKTVIDPEYLTFGKLNNAIENLQDKLKYNFFIYPNKYFKGLKESCSNKFICKELVSNDVFNSKITTNEINQALTEFRKLKPTDIKTIADYFFIYDYYKKSTKNKKNIKRDAKGLIYNNIKYELTRFHGLTLIEKDKTKRAISYDACKQLCDNDSDFSTDKNVDFYIGEKTIRNRLKLMESFIDDEYYKYLIFN